MPRRAVEALAGQVGHYEALLRTRRAMNRLLITAARYDIRILSGYDAEPTLVSQAALASLVKLHSAASSARVLSNDFQTLVFAHPFALNRPPLDACDRSSGVNPHDDSSSHARRAGIDSPKRWCSCRAAAKTRAHDPSFSKWAVLPQF